MSGWKPIETAPRNGEIVVVKGWYDSAEKEKMLAAAARVSSYDSSGKDIWFRDNNGYGFTVQCNPTHWGPGLSYGFVV